MTQHVVKSWSHLFQPFLDGVKTHDIRIMDRDYKVGDKLILQEWDWKKKEYTGREAAAEITYITDVNSPCAFSPFALDNDFGILSIKKIEE
jgi:hypothetical protein